jgi:hypothetical protein
MRIEAENIWGYTARHDDRIGLALVALVQDQPERFAMRFSNARVPPVLRPDGGALP